MNVARVHRRRLKYGIQPTESQYLRQMSGYQEYLIDGDLESKYRGWDNTNLRSFTIADAHAVFAVLPDSDWQEITAKKLLLHQYQVRHHIANNGMDKPKTALTCINPVGNW